MGTKAVNLIYQRLLSEVLFSPMAQSVDYLSHSI